VTSNETIAALRRIVGDRHVTTGADIAPGHLADARMAMPEGEAPAALVCPANAAEISAVLKLCRSAGLAVVPQGGMTGLAGGAVPLPGSVAVALGRLSRIEEIDTAAATMTVEAGVPLEIVQRVADDAGFLFALDLGARGSCHIGGVTATNAGGNRVLRFGMMRDLVLGIEVVLADGTIVTSLNKMMKNNAGYDLKHLFIGSEGTLGIVTRLVLRLHPKPRSVATAFCGFAKFDDVLAFLGRARAELGGTLATFEVMWPEFYRIAIEEAGRRPPLPPAFACYVLIEMMGTDSARDPEKFAAFMEQSLDDRLIADAVVAGSEVQRGAFWHIRDASSEFSRGQGIPAGFDVSVPVGDIGRFVEDVAARLAAAFPDLRPVIFGHLADGNIHVEIRRIPDERARHDIEEIVYGATRDWGGSVSAEHGIGLVKKPYLAYSRTPEEIALMRTLKTALDPDNILNPGKIF
jgi:FAD/FMN-containing dehydrogenase